MSDDDIEQEDLMRLQSVTAPDDQTRLNVDSNRVFLEGSKNIPGFEGSVDALKQAGITSGDFLAQVLETDAPHKVLHALGQDVALAKKVAALPPVKRAAAFAALDRGEPIPEPRMPTWKTPKAMRHEDDYDDKTWSRMYNEGKLPSQQGRRR
jgi:hypothetical protein